MTLQVLGDHRFALERWKILRERFCWLQSLEGVLGYLQEKSPRLLAKSAINVSLSETLSKTGLLKKSCLLPAREVHLELFEPPKMSEPFVAQAENVKWDPSPACPSPSPPKAPLAHPPGKDLALQEELAWSLELLQSWT